MSRGAQTFKQGDLTRASKAAVKAGLQVQRVEFDSEGKPVLVTGKQPKQAKIEDATALIG